MPAAVRLILILVCLIQMYLGHVLMMKTTVRIKWLIHTPFILAKKE